MKHTYKLNKLVRDRDADGMRADGAIVNTRPLGMNELLVQLLAKITEEIGEIQKAPTPRDMARESADLIEAVRAYGVLRNCNGEVLMYTARALKPPADQSTRKLLLQALKETAAKLKKEGGDLVETSRLLALTFALNTCDTDRKKRYSQTAVEKFRTEKAKARGGFRRGVFIETVSCPPHSKWDDYFARQIEKNPRI